MKKIFELVQMTRPKRSRFDLSHQHVFDTDLGYLIPTMVLETNPTDSYDIKISNFVRFNPLIAPVMHEYIIDTHVFKVPLRILWSNFDEWIKDDLAVEAPNTKDLNTLNDDHLGAYLGYVKTATGNQEVSAFRMAAYFKIWNYWYRDQNLQSEETIATLGNGYNSPAKLKSLPKRVAWNPDYLTSSLPWAQKGDEVLLPLSDNPLEVTLVSGATNPVKAVKAFDQSNLGATSGLKTGSDSFIESATPDDIQIDPNSTLEVATDTTATNIINVRRAFALQKILEKRARGGTRIKEYIQNFFGGKYSDARLQEPELIGGFRQKMSISEVLATAETTAASINVGNLAGHGISVGQSNRMKIHTEEHCIIMALSSCRPVTAYKQGIPKQLLRTDPYDYPIPELQHIGEQEVYVKEVCAEFGTDVQLDTVFGYNMRYAEERYQQNRISGKQKGNLSYWNHAREFSGVPALNSAFIECAPREDMFAVTSEPHLVWAARFDISAIKPLGKFANPSL